MQKQFKEWLIREGKSPNTANSYASAINSISKHYSQATRKPINIWAIEDVTAASKIAADYNQNGKFSEFGYAGNSTNRNAIARYAEFLTSRRSNADSIEAIAEKVIKNTDGNPTNFAYEKDLQTALCAQISELFPEYHIYGKDNEGIEFCIFGKRIDVLLEHNERPKLLAVELKSGLADFKVFGQISMYLGLLSEKFPNHEISGSIIAGQIDKGLRYACQTNSRITIKSYRMRIELEDI